MNYTKPEVVELGSAVTSIQAHGKPRTGVLDVFPNQTIPAYEADE